MFFNNCKTVAELKSSYRKTCMIFHPDNKETGDTETMKKVNAEYEETFKRLSVQNEHEAKEESDEFINIFKELLKHASQITIEICGTWIWIGGSTKPIKDLLKSLKFKWHSKKNLWYYTTDSRKRRVKKVLPMDEIRYKYGSRIISYESESNTLLKSHLESKS